MIFAFLLLISYVGGPVGTPSPLMGPNGPYWEACDVYIPFLAELGSFRAFRIGEHGKGLETMTKYNVVTKAKRSKIQERKRAQHSNGKLKQKTDNNIPVSGKRKRKLLNKWRKVPFPLLFRKIRSPVFFLFFNLFLPNRLRTRRKLCRVA